MHLQEEIARCITKENGKTLVDARGDVFRGLGAFLYNLACFLCMRR